MLCGPLRISAISALKGRLTQRSQRYAEGRREKNLRFERVMCGQWKQITIALFLCSLSAIAVNAQKQQPTPTPKVTGHTITLDDGYSFQVDEYWKQGDEVWYRKGNITQRI